MADALTVDELRADFEHSKRMQLTRPRFSTEELGTLFAEIERLRADGRHLRSLLAVRVAMPHTYYDDGEAQGQQHGISIDFMREPVADIDAKLRALNVARLECATAPPASQPA